MGTGLLIYCVVAYMLSIIAIGFIFNEVRNTVDGLPRDYLHNVDTSVLSGIGTGFIILLAPISISLIIGSFIFDVGLTVYENTTTFIGNIKNYREKERSICKVKKDLSSLKHSAIPK